MKDDIVEEIRQARKKIEQEAGGTPETLAKHVMEKQKEHGDKLVSRKPQYLSKRKVG